MDVLTLLPLVWQARHPMCFNCSSVWGMYWNVTISGNHVQESFVLADMHFCKQHLVRADISKSQKGSCLLPRRCLCFQPWFLREEARDHQILPTGSEEWIWEACVTEQSSTSMQSNENNRPYIQQRGDKELPHTSWKHKPRNNEPLNQLLYAVQSVTRPSKFDTSSYLTTADRLHHNSTLHC